jgi:hypothetical protein
MTTTRTLRAAIVPWIVVSLAGCTGRIWVDHQSDDGLRLRWYTDEASIDDATSRAGELCAASGRRATLVQEFEDQDVTLAEFACR